MAKSRAEIDAFIAQVMSAPAHRAHGLTAISAAEGEARLEFDAGPAAFTPNGGVHGGVLAMLMEPAALCALFPMLPAGRRAVTVDMHVQHMRPVRPHARAAIVGRVLRLGGSMAFCETAVIDDGRICSAARLTKAVVG